MKYLESVEERGVPNDETENTNCMSMPWNDNFKRHGKCSEEEEQNTRNKQVN